MTQNVVPPVAGQDLVQTANCTQTVKTVPVQFSPYGNEGMNAYLLVSPATCNLPHLYCIYMFQNTGGGLSCEIVSQLVVDQFITQ